MSATPHSVRCPPGRGACKRLDAPLDTQVRAMGGERSGGDGRGAEPGVRECRSGSAAQGRPHGLDADPRRLGLRHTEAFEDIQRLPERDPRGVGAPQAKRGLCDALEDLLFLIRVTDLPGQPESGLVEIGSFAVPPGSAAYAGYPAQGGGLLVQISDLLGDRLCFLVADQRLVETLRALVNRTGFVEDAGLIKEMAKGMVDGEAVPVSGERVFVAPLVMIDSPDVVVQDRLVLRPAYLAEYFQ